MDVDEQREAEWEATKRDYAQPNSDVDIGNMYYWAGYWHERYKAALTHERAQKQPVADVERVARAIDEIMQEQDVYEGIWDEETDTKWLCTQLAKAAFTATKPVADETTYVAMPADAANPHAHAALTTMQQPSQGVGEEELADLIRSVSLNEEINENGIPMTLRFTSVGSLRVARALIAAGVIKGV